jgi:cytochrome c biogenesis protein CcdA
MSDTFQRWQENTRRALDFVNNVLIAVGAGLIAVVLAQSADVPKTAVLPLWHRIAAGIAVILLGLSVVAGLFAAENRLQSIRLTTRRIRIMELRDRVFAHDKPCKKWEHDRLRENIRS